MELLGFSNIKRPGNWHFQIGTVKIPDGALL